MNRMKKAGFIIHTYMLNISESASNIYYYKNPIDVLWYNTTNIFIINKQYYLDDLSKLDGHVLKMNKLNVGL